MYIKRQLESIIIKGSRNYPVILLTGPRQVGKSRLLKEIKEDTRNYVTLDDPIERSLAQNNPELFLKTHPYPLIIDEIQYAPGLFPYIKMMVDLKDEDGMYWISGSQVFPLMKNVGESLAGRVLILRLQGISQGEENEYFSSPVLGDMEDIISRKSLEIDIDNRILRGCFPRIITHKEIAENEFYGSYVSTWIERDVSQITNILDADLFLKFVRVMATRSGQELNMADISKDVGVDAKTVDRWLDILLTSGLVIKIQPWSGNVGKRLVKRPKIYFLDTGILCYLLGIDSVTLLNQSILYGNIFETYVVIEILKTFWNNAIRPNIFYYRDTNQKEIDLIIETQQNIIPVEIKTSLSAKNPYKNFNVLDPIDDKVIKKLLIYNGEKLVSHDNKTWWIPINKI